MPATEMPVEILLVEDSPSDVHLTQTALRRSRVRNNLSVARDGSEAVEFLRRRGRFENAPRPDLILLDLNMPKMNGHEVLEEIKRDPSFRAIPVVMLTTSEEDHDVLRSYDLHANCFMTKPIDLDKFLKVIAQFEDFWLSVVRLPPAPASIGGA